MAQVKKLAGNFPETVQIKNIRVLFGDSGVAEVTSELAKVFQQIPGYMVSGLDSEENITSEVHDTPDDSEEQEVKDLESAVAPDTTQTKRTSKKATPKK